MTVVLATPLLLISVTLYAVTSAVGGLTDYGADPNKTRHYHRQPGRDDPSQR